MHKESQKGLYIFLFFSKELFHFERRLERKMCASQIKLSFWKSRVPRGCFLGLHFELKGKNIERKNIL